MSTRKRSRKGGIIFGLILFLIVLVAVWYFLGMPGYDTISQKIPVPDKVTEFVEQHRSDSEKLKEDVKQSIENVKKDLQQTAESVTEELQNVLNESLGRETSSGSAGTNKTVSKNGNEYSSAECDLNHPENSPLFFGNPSDCVEDVQQEQNFLLTKTQFSISYNNNTLCPNWVGWHLCTADLGKADRSDKFVPDKTLPAEWHAVTKADYQYNAYGFDRGHICPSADRTATQLDNEITFLMTNMVPQAPDCNRIVWMHLENYERELAKDGNELYIFAGPYGKGGIGAKGLFEEIPIKTKDGKQLAINVPEYTWKVILILDEGETDFSRVTTDTKILSVCVPNKQGCNKNGDWEQYLCSVDYIEEITGYDFFELLPDEIEDVIEAQVWAM